MDGSPALVGRKVALVAATRSTEGDTAREQEVTVDDLAGEVGPMAYRIALNMLGDPVSAEDAVHDAYLQAHRGLKSFRGDARLRTWFMRIVVNSCRRHRRLWRRWVVGNVEVERARADEIEAPVLGDPGLRERIEAGVLRLPHRQRTAFVLRYTQDLSIDEIAEVMGCASGTVKATLFKAVRKLRSELEDLVGDES
jgi:RNA polymerase sigma-70 factor (ECF subfamily)